MLVWFKLIWNLTWYFAIELLYNLVELYLFGTMLKRIFTCWDTYSHAYHILLLNLLPSISQIFCFHFLRSKFYICIVIRIEIRNISDLLNTSFFRNIRFWKWRSQYIILLIEHFSLSIFVNSVLRSIPNRFLWLNNLTCTLWTLRDISWRLFLSTCNRPIKLIIILPFNGTVLYCCRYSWYLLRLVANTHIITISNWTYWMVHMLHQRISFVTIGHRVTSHSPSHIKVLQLYRYFISLIVLFVVRILWTPIHDFVLVGFNW